MFILFLLLFFGMIFYVFLHEMGHGICAVLFTKKPVTLFLGSYGKTEKNFKTTIGLFTFYIEYNPLKWKGGLCYSEKGNMNFYQSVIYLVAGSVFPILAGCIFLILSKMYGNEYLYLFAIIFLSCSVLELLVNLWPSKKRILLNKGGYTHRDGYQIFTLFKYRKLHKEYMLAINYYNAKQYDKAIPYLKYLLENGMDTEERIYTITISACLMHKDFDGAKQLIGTFSRQFNPSLTDLINFGYYYSQIEDHGKAMEYYHKSLMQKETWMGYNNYGYSLNVLERYPEAIEYFDKAIKMAPKHAFPYNNRGLAKIKLGNSEDGLKDLEYSFSLDPENSYYYKSMGIYHFDRGEFEPALKMFETARQKDATTYKIDDHIKETKLLLA